MSKFFDSEHVKNEMEEITSLQKELYDVILKFPKMSSEAKVEHIDTVMELLERQQIMWTRLSLTDDPDAKRMKEYITNHSKELGFGDTDLPTIFANMKRTLQQVQSNLKR
jgi:hypothetical protein|tara:strand:- start:2405 stop:2734 length:330 start_codon:yes stop_codon:yes gene_type:complete